MAWGVRRALRVALIVAFVGVDSSLVDISFRSLSAWKKAPSVLPFKEADFLQSLLKLGTSIATTAIASNDNHTKHRYWRLNSYTK